MKKWHLKILGKVKQEKLSKQIHYFQAEGSTNKKGSCIHKNTVVIKYLLQ